jgi:hypothetical protein
MTRPREVADAASAVSRETQASGGPSLIWISRQAECGLIQPQRSERETDKIEAQLTGRVVGGVR